VKLDTDVSAGVYRRVAGVLAALGLIAGAGAAVLSERRGDDPRLAPPPELTRNGEWAAPNADLAATRAARGSSIRASNVSRLRPAWRFRYVGTAGFSGIAASTPVVSGGVVFTQDLNSAVHAVDLRTGRLLWSHRYGRVDGGPNGVAFGHGAVFGNTDVSTFALDAATGRELWRTRLTTEREPLTIAPAVAGELVLTSTTAQARGGRGAFVALDRRTGRVQWRFDTIRDRWRYPDAYGGGAWQTPTIDDDGAVYWGTANPNPWGGTRQRPNGGSYPGAVPYTDSLVVLDGETGDLRWFDQVTAHDVRDLDFQDPPVLADVDGDPLVLGAGKSGRVIAWDRQTHERRWEQPVGLHRNDAGPLPARPTEVCPGFLGGVETPMAYADGVLFVPVVDLCFPESSRGTTAFDFFSFDSSKGRGRLVALDAETGRRLWERRLPSAVFGCATVANDVVFTATFDGWVYALAAGDGKTLWSVRARAGINACPSVAGDTLLVVAGTDHPSFVHEPMLELEAYRLGRVYPTQP
jgi:outer membrane protein assembly factor BamB